MSRWGWTASSVARATRPRPRPVWASWDPIVGRVTGNRTAVRGRLWLLVVLAAMLAVVHTAAAAQTTNPRIDILQVDGALDGTIARYVDDALRTAADDGVEVVVVQLSTPGTLDVPAARLVDAIRSSPVPVVVWAGPPGARVTGAGVQLALAADVLALAPGAVLGGAVPADLGVATDAAARRDTAAELSRLAQERDRPPAIVASMATDHAAVVVAPTGQEQLSADAALPAVVDADRVSVLGEQEAVDTGLVDLVAAGLPELLAQLDGWELTRVDGAATQLTVDPATATIRFNNQGLLGRLLHTVSTPTLAYLLVIGGVVALLFEWFQPGFGVAGISGGVLAALGLYGMTVLPAQWWALALVLVGLVLLALDLALARLGPLTAAGAIALTAGSWWLYDGPAAMRLAGWLIALTVVSAVVFFVFVMTTVLRAQGIQTRAGMQAVMGRTGVVRSVLNPQGHVFVGGVLWRAQAPDAAGQVRTGTTVRVTGVADELTLLVEPVERVDADQQAPAHQA
jgi:membrane-bound serine protease (ClpP class)